MATPPTNPSTSDSANQERQWTRNSDRARIQAAAMPPMAQVGSGAELRSRVEPPRVGRWYHRDHLALRPSGRSVSPEWRRAVQRSTMRPSEIVLTLISVNTTGRPVAEIPKNSRLVGSPTDDP